MKTLSLFIAWRYIRGAGHEKNISIMLIICFIGICIGSFALALVASVMNGFEKATHEKLQGIHPQIMIRSFGNQLDVKAFASLFKEKFPEIEAFSPVHDEQVMIQNPSTSQVEHVMAIKGFIPKKEEQVTQLKHKIKNLENRSLEKIFEKPNSIIIGSKIAQLLNLHIGDKVNILFAPHDQHSKKIILDSHPAFISSIFETGIEDYDMNVIFSTLPFVHTLFPDSGISQIDIKLKPGTDEQNVIDELRSHLTSVEVNSWKDLYPAIVSALKLEKYVMFIILALITLVASMNIISLLFMQITQKRGDIAILQTLGCKQTTIRNIFLLMGLSVSCLATLVGLTLSVIASWILEHYPFIELPDVYYVSHLPARMELSILVIVFCVVMTLSFVATIIPARRIKNLTIAQILRFEA